PPTTTTLRPASLSPEGYGGKSALIGPFSRETPRDWNGPTLRTRVRTDVHRRARSCRGQPRSPCESRPVPPVPRRGLLHGVQCRRARRSAVEGRPGRRTRQHLTAVVMAGRSGGHQELRGDLLRPGRTDRVRVLALGRGRPASECDVTR